MPRKNQIGMYVTNTHSEYIHYSMLNTVHNIEYCTNTTMLVIGIERLI